MPRGVLVEGAFSCKTACSGIEATGGKPSFRVALSVCVGLALLRHFGQFRKFDGPLAAIACGLADSSRRATSIFGTRLGWSVCCAPINHSDAPMTSRRNATQPMTRPARLASAGDRIPFTPSIWERHALSSPISHDQCAAMKGEAERLPLKPECQSHWKRALAEPNGRLRHVRSIGRCRGSALIGATAPMRRWSKGGGSKIRVGQIVGGPIGLAKAKAGLQSPARDKLPAG